MQNFIQQVVTELLQNHTDFRQVTIVTSSKRSAVFLKQTLKENGRVNSFLPKILSIEDFITDVSQITPVDTIEILFKFYTIYTQKTPKKNLESFDTFIHWASIVLNDFNEMDQYLVETDKILSYLSDIKRIESWFEDNKQTKLSKNYIRFFENLKTYYNALRKQLLKENKGYQGLIYRKAHENIEQYIQNNKNEHFVFLGLNALNKTEEIIVNKLLSYKMASIYFDVDLFLLNNNTSYGKFINKYKNEWNYFNTHPFKFLSNDFINPKQINIVGLPKNISLIKEASAIIKNIHQKNENLQNTALVLSNENLLEVSLNSLPTEVQKVNITMGYPLKNMHVASFFNALLKMYKNQEKLHLKNQFYYKDIVSILSDATLQSVFKNQNIDIKQLISDKILKQNLIFLTTNQIYELTDNPYIKKALKLVFNSEKDIQKILNINLELINEIKKQKINYLENEYLNRLYQILNQILLYNKTHQFVQNLDTLMVLYKQLISSETLSFKGEPLEGLQIMGMLETRNLDFENIIITSVNEGFLPSGKQGSSFIPFDVRKEIGLPTYTEKDAIFSYHFFRLLQRAKNIYLLYNTETDDFGASEKSRFLLQLEQYTKKIPSHQLIQSIVSPISKLRPKKPIVIPKTKKIIDILDTYNENKGFSPSALSIYIANPLYFYQQRILKIKEIDQVEETVALNTMGTIIHDVLEDLYKPYLKTILTKEILNKLKKKANERILFYFKKHYNNDHKKGKNLLIFEIIKQYISNFLNLEINSVKQGNKIIVLALEKELKTSIKINDGSKTINLKGFADRIESYNDIIRIIDYKTGKAEQKMLNKKNWDTNRNDFKSYSKRFQLMFYAYCYIKENNVNIDSTEITSGIISFKNLKEGFLKVNNSTITKQDITDFEQELTFLLEEIYDTQKPFIENENPPF